VCAECIYICSWEHPDGLCKNCAAYCNSSSTLHGIIIYNIIINHITPHATPAQPFSPRVSDHYPIVRFFSPPNPRGSTARQPSEINQKQILRESDGDIRRINFSLYTLRIYCSAYSVNIISYARFFSRNRVLIKV